MTTYRARIEEGPRCRFHKLAQASETCARCGASICDVCATFATSHVACPGCADAIGRRQRLRRAGIVIGVIGAVAAGGALLYRGLLTQKDTYDDITALEHQVDKEPGCHDQVVLNLARTLHDAHLYRREIGRLDAYLDSGCEISQALFDQQRAALDADGQHAAAAQAATRQIDEHPLDETYWQWRAESYEKLGRLEEAAADYEQCLALQPQNINVPEHLARVYEKLGRPCDAVAPLVQFLHYHADMHTNGITAWASKLATSEACKPFEVRGTELFAFPRDPTERGAARAEVRIDGHGPATFEADTRQSVTLVSRAFADRAGLPAIGPVRRVHTPDGLQEATMVTAGLVTAGGVEAPRVQLAVVGQLPEGVDGILGLSFLLRFRIVPTLEGLRLAPPPTAP